MRAAHATPLIVALHGVARRLERLPIGTADNAFDEAWLRDLLHQNPASLPVSEIEPGFQRLVPICTEFPTKHGPIDNLFLTPTGDIVLVEVKLWRNPEARRKVIAQALDYASCIFEMDYAEMEHSVRRRLEPEGAKFDGLYDLFTDCEADLLNEPDLVDAVNANLRRGRALILVVGDGIRTETSRLTNLLQSHAGAHFTFGLVEMAAYSMPDSKSWLLCPRILARTEMISRGVVHISAGRVTVQKPPEGEDAPSRSHTITEEQFFTSMSEIDPDLPARLYAFLEKIEPLGVYPSFQRSLNLKWDPPDGKPINFGYIKRDGKVWTDASNWFAPTDLSHLYNEELAQAFGMDVDRETFPENWHIRLKGKAPRISDMARDLDKWIPVIQNFIERVRERLTESNPD